ncbi:MAG: hypothetical protein KAT43_04430 [Nanoarchaeota archaeon]|nr:hypothetical protein [Nanoarchaeota archaeon]
MGKKSWIVASLLSSLVIPVLAVAQTGYQESTKQMTGAFKMAFGWLPAVLKIKSVVFGVMLIFFWIFLYNLLLTGIKKWMLKDGDVSKMHKTMAGSLAAVMLLSVFFVSKDPMARATQIAGSFHMFFAVIISLAVYFISKHTMRTNTDGKSGGFQAVIIGAMCLLLFTYLAEGTAFSGIRYMVMGFALLALIGSLIMKVGSTARGWGCDKGYDPFGDQTDQIPRAPGSIGDAGSRFAGSIFGLGGRAWRWYQNRGLTPEQLEYHARIEELENAFRGEFKDFRILTELYDQKAAEIPRMRTIYHTKWKKCKKFIEKTLPSILTKEHNFIRTFADNVDEAAHTVESLFAALGAGIPGGLTNAQRVDIMARLTAHQAAILDALKNLDNSILVQLTIIDDIKKNSMNTPTLLGNILTDHLSPPGGEEFAALAALDTALQGLREDIEAVLAGAAPAAAAALPYAAEIAEHIDTDTGANALTYNLGAGAHEFRTLRQFFNFFRDPGPEKDFLFEEHVVNRAPENDFANWVDGVIGCPALAAHIRTLATVADLRNFIRGLPRELF